MRQSEQPQTTDAPPTFAIVSWFRSIGVGHIGSWGLPGLVDRCGCVAGVGCSANSLRPDAGLLVADGGRSLRPDGRLVFGFDDLAAEVLVCYPVVRWIDGG